MANPFLMNPFAFEEKTNPMLAPQQIIGQPAPQVNPMLNPNLAQQSMLGNQGPETPAPQPAALLAQPAPQPQGLTKEEYKQRRAENPLQSGNQSRLSIIAEALGELFAESANPYVDPTGQVPLNTTLVAPATGNYLLNPERPSFSESFSEPLLEAAQLPTAPVATAPTTSATTAPTTSAATAPSATVGVEKPTIQQLFTLPENVAPGSPQANFLIAQSKGQVTPEKIAQAQALAESMGTTFDKETGYSRQPFLDAQGQAQQATSNAPMPSQAIGQYPMQANQFSQEAAAQVNPILAPQIDQTFDQAQVSIPPSLQNPFATQATQAPQAPQATSNAPMGEEATRQRLADMFGSSAPITLNQGLTGNPDAVMRQDAQGRMRSYANEEEYQKDLQATRDFVAQQSTDRQDRLPQGAGEVRGPDSTDRAAGEKSFSTYVDLAGGNRDLARVYQQRERNGLDMMSGQPLKPKTEGGGAMTFEQEISARRQRLAEEKFNYERVNDFNKASKEEMTDIRKEADAQSRDAMTGKGMKRSVLDMLDVMDNVAGRLGQFMSTGMTGKAASFWKGSEADAQEADFAFLKSNVALKAMMELKAQSSTGATGFGALNTEELKVLTNRFATLDPFTKPEIIRENLVRLRDQTTAMFEDAKIRHAEKYSPEAAEAVYGDLIRATGGGKGASSKSPIPNDKNVASAADALLSSGKY